MKKLLILRFMISAYVGNLDPFERVVWLDLSEGNTLEDTISNEVIKIIETAMALTWEAVCCATPTIRGADIEVVIENITYEAEYHKNILSHDTKVTGWTPELSNIVNDASLQMKEDLKNVLVDMVKTCSERSHTGGNHHYEIRQRT